MLRKLLLISAGIFTGAVIVEIILRTIPENRIHGKETGRQGLYEYDELLGWRMKKNTVVVEHIYGRTATYITNKLGFRGSLPQKEKLIALMGDSLIFGVGLNEDETISFNLEKITGYSVINTGVVGYSPDQIYLQLKRDVIKLKPDIVIFTVFPGNDIDDLPNKIPISFTGPQPQKPYFEIIENKLVLKNHPVPLEKIESKRDVAFNVRKFLRKNLKIIQIIKPYVKYYLYSPLKNLGILEGIEDYEYSFKLLEKILIEANKLASKNKINFYIMILPRDMTRWDRLQQQFILEIEKICSKNNIKCLLPIDPFETEKYYFKNSWHPSPYGAVYIAKRIKELIGL